MFTERAKIAAGFIVISLIWGSTWLAIKIGLDSVPPFYGVAIRFMIATIILGFMVVIRRESIPLTKHAFFLYGSLALLSFSFPYALVYWGEQYISSGLASILFAAYPFVVALCSHFVLRNERLNMYKVTGIGLGFAGILVIFWSDLDLGSASTSGMAAILLSTVMQGTSLVIVKRHNSSLSPTALTFGGMVLGEIILLAIALSVESFSSVALDAKGIGSIVYLGTFGSVVTFVTYYWLLKHVEAVYLSLVSFVTPVLAVVLGAVALGEELSSRVVAGGAFILLGIVSSNGQELLKKVRKGATL